MPSYIHDNVHGRIALTDLERDVIETPSFVRLNHIAQLGLTSFVFPGATHTRASHCAGTLSVVARVCRQLKLSETETTQLRLAALLHDSGQYPLSHAIETVYRIRGRPLAQIVKNPEELDDLAGRSALQTVSIRPTGEYARDKALAAEVIQRRSDLQAVFKKHGLSDDDIESIAKIVQGKHASTLYRQLLDSDYDCDRLDYVGRDGLMAGVPYGKIDLDYLIENMSAVKHPPNGVDRVLALDKRKALHALEHYLTSRYYLYSQVVFHKTVRGFELMAKALYYSLAEAGDVPGDFASLVDDIDDNSFATFDDHYFWDRVRRAANSADATVKRLANRLATRSPLGFVMEFKGLFEGEKPPATYARAANWLLKPNNLSVIVNDADLTPQQVVAEEVSIDFVPIGSEVPVSDLIQRPTETEKAVRNTPYLLNERDQIEFLLADEATILRALSTRRLKTLRLYVEGSDDDEARLSTAALARIED